MKERKKERKEGNANYCAKNARRKVREDSNLEKGKKARE